MTTVLYTAGNLKSVSVLSNIFNNSRVITELIVINWYHWLIVLNA